MKSLSAVSYTHLDVYKRQLLYMSGASERMGRVEDGTTASDFDPEEIRRKASLNSSVVPVEYEGIKYNLIDAPGLFDFETGAAEGIMAAESVLICVSGRSGVTVGAEKAYPVSYTHLDVYKRQQGW